jgi:hypothetical protein
VVALWSRGDRRIRMGLAAELNALERRGEPPRPAAAPATVAELEGRLADLAAQSPELYGDVLAGLEQHLAACEHFLTLAVVTPRPPRRTDERGDTRTKGIWFDPAYLAALRARTRARLGRRVNR